MRKLRPPASTPKEEVRPAPSPRRRRRTQFTIFSLMVLMFVASIGFASLYYMVRAAQGDTSARPVAIMMAVAMPMLITIVMSVGYSVRNWLRRR